MSKEPGEHDSLRMKAEAQLARTQLAKATDRPAEELLHELRVHQIELDMQREELLHFQIALEESRDHYIDFYDFAPVGYIALTDDGRISEINLAGAALLGVERSSVLQQHLARFVAPEDHDRMHHHFLEAQKGGDKLTCELQFQRGDGSRFLAHLDSLRPLRDGMQPLLRIVVTDITERKQKDEALRQQEEFFRMIAENTEDFIAVLDLQGKRLYNNPTYARIFGDTESLKGTDSFAEIHPDDQEHVKRVFSETVQSGMGMRTDFRFLLGDGSIRHMESRGGLIKNSQGHATHVIVVSRDITERKLAEDRIYHLAFYDDLTRLPNRRLLDDRLAQTMSASKRSRRFGALLFIDLDNFKPLNDKHGHAVGDSLLEEVARRIGRCVRGMDTVARFGGDEFVVLLSELDMDHAKSVTEAGLIADKIHAVLAEPYRLTVQQGISDTSLAYHCTSSIGIELFIDHEESPEEIIRRADLAMYQAKNAGRNSIRFFDPTMPVNKG